MARKPDQRVEDIAYQAAIDTATTLPELIVNYRTSPEFVLRAARRTLADIEHWVDTRREGK